MRIAPPPFDHQLYEEQLRVFLPCAHPRAEPRRRIKATGHPFYRIQCPDCGKLLSGPLAFSMVEDWRLNLGPIKPVDESKYHQWVKRRLAIGDLLKASEALRRNAAWWRQYEDYLAGPEWKQRRERILQRAKGTCERCRDQRAQHVHHLTYQRVGEEIDDDLMAVCMPCHQALHPDRPLLAAL